MSFASASAAERRESSSSALLEALRSVKGNAMKRSQYTLALTNSGFDTSVIAAARRLAQDKKQHVLIRPRNIATEFSLYMAMLQKVLVAFKSMELSRYKSGAQGSLLARQASAGAALVVGRTSMERADLDEASEAQKRARAIAAQKSENVKNSVAVASLDVILVMMKTGRLQQFPRLIHQVVLVKNKDNPDQSFEVDAYFLEFKATLPFQSSKGNIIRVQIPETWLDDDKLSHLALAGNSQYQELRPEPILLAEAEYYQRQKEVKTVTGYVAEAANESIRQASKSRCAEMKPFDSFVFDRIYRDDYSPAKIRKDWQELFDDYGMFKRFFRDDFFESASPTHPRGRYYERSEAEKEDEKRLKSFLETAVLTRHEYDEAMGCVLPWPSVERVQENLRGEPAIVCSDVDFAAFCPSVNDGEASSWRAKCPEVTDLGEDVHANKDGAITGSGLRRDCESLRCFNEEYQHALRAEHITETELLGGRSSLYTDFLQAQIDGRIQAAHHGAENFNYKNNVEGTKKYFKEGFLWVKPNGDLDFVSGEEAIKNAIIAICDAKYFVPISKLWADILFPPGIDRHRNLLIIDLEPYALIQELKYIAGYPGQEGFFAEVQGFCNAASANPGEIMKHVRQPGFVISDALKTVVNNYYKELKGKAKKEQEDNARYEKLLPYLQVNLRYRRVEFLKDCGGYREGPPIDAREADNLLREWIKEPHEDWLDYLIDRAKDEFIKAVEYVLKYARADEKEELLKYLEEPSEAELRENRLAHFYDPRGRDKIFALSDQLQEQRQQLVGDIEYILTHANEAEKAGFIRAMQAEDEKHLRDNFDFYFENRAAYQPEVNAVKVRTLGRSPLSAGQVAVLVSAGGSPAATATNFFAAPPSSSSDPFSVGWRR